VVWDLHPNNLSEVVADRLRKKKTSDDETDAGTLRWIELPDDDPLPKEWIHKTSRTIAVQHLMTSLNRSIHTFFARSRHHNLFDFNADA